MANIEDYNAKLATIKAIPAEEVQEPAIPVNAFTQEAENLYDWALKDKAELKVVGITNAMIEELQPRIGACRQAQSIWDKDYLSRQEAQKQWAEENPKAYALRNDLLASLRFAYRKDEALLGRVRAIAEGDSHADMIQDLNTIAVLGRDNTELLTAIGFDLTQLEKAATLSDELANLLARANGDKANVNESKLIRDQAYTHLKELVDEIREAGKYVFRKDAKRLEGYSSQYRRNRRKTDTDKAAE